MTRRLRVAIVGTGIGGTHLAGFRALPDLWEVVAVCDVDWERAAALAAAHGVRRVESDLARLVGDPAIDVVDLCTPPYQHFAQISAVLEAGQHVICEKPLVGSLAEVDALAALAAGSEGALLPILQKRFGNGLMQLRHLMALGLTGRAYVTTVENHWRRGADYYAVPWRGRWATELGGVNLTQAIHAQDIVMAVLGPVARVFAATRTAVNPIEVEDCSATLAEMADGSLATFSATLGAATEITRLRFVFEQVTVESCHKARDFTDAPWSFRAPDAARQRAIDAALADAPRIRESFAGQFEDFHRSLTEGTPPAVTLDDSRRSLELATAIYHSAGTGAPVALPIGRDHPAYHGWRPPGVDRAGGS